MALLKPKTIPTTTVTFRLPTHVVDELDAVKKAADERGLALDITFQVERAIVTLTKAARSELNAAAAPSKQIP
jgi:hypothetical protein